ncbi:MAG: polar amino acid transport system substrate-binding protein [Psychromonas sp.]|jgi:polar amino acid transport system substrate-binding protein|uniref:substrate-binding periplasmic protein n=1 Tax=Psychromonas sp. TaxID=1884585 RepID=UPI0039E5F0CC
MSQYWLCMYWLVAGYCSAVPYQVVVNHAPPYRIIENGTFSGIYIDILKAAALEAEIELEFINVPFKRALLQMRTGQADIMLGPNKTQERTRFMHYINEVPFPRENKAFYASKPERCIDNYEELYGKTVEVLIGAVYFDRFDQDNKIIRLKTRNYKAAMGKVVIGRSDLVIMPERQGDRLNKQEKFSLVKCDFKVAGKLSYITVSKQSKDKELLERLSKALLAIGKKHIPEYIAEQYIDLLSVSAGK